MKKLKSMLFLLSSAAIWGLSGCVDKNYDLSGDIDLTIGIGGDEFAIPGGNTEELLLNDVLDIKEGDLVQADEHGNYYLEQKGDSPSTTDIHINDVEVKSSEIQEISKTVTLNPTPVPGTTEEDWTGDFPNNFIAHFELDSELPEEITSLEYIYANLVVELNLAYEMEGLKKANLEDFKIIVPEYLHSDEIQNGVYEGGHIELTHNQPHSIKILIKGIDCTQFPEGTIRDQLIHLEDSIQLGGKAIIHTSDFEGQAEGEKELVLTLNTSIYDIKVHSVDAYINPQIDLTIDPIKINDVPEFLTDEEVVLDVLNPMIVFDVDNQSPIDVLVDGTLTSQYNADRNLEPVQVGFGGVEILSNLVEAPKHYCLWAKESRKGQVPTDTTFVQVAELPTLIEKIPDQVLVDINPQANQQKLYNIEINHTYNLSTDYRVRVPFQFGPELAIVYKDTVNGWMEHLEKYYIKRAMLTGFVTSKLPLDLELTAVPMTKEHASDPDDQCFELEGVTAHVLVEGVIDQAIPAGDINQPVKAAIVVEFVETIPGQMKKLDGLQFRAQATAGEQGGKNLNKNQSIQFTELRLKVPGGAVIDGNNL